MCVRFRNYAKERREKEEKKKGKKRSGLDRNLHASFVWSATLYGNKDVMLCVKN